MMRPRWRKVLSDLIDNKLRSALVVMSIAVGVFAVGMIAGAYTIISEDLAISYASGNPGNIQIFGQPIEQEMIDSIENVPGVEKAEGRRHVSVQMRLPEGDWQAVDLLANPDFEDSQINLLTSLAGAPFPAEKELVLEKQALENLPVAVGDVLEVKLSDGTLRSMPVVGIVQDQTSAAGDFLANPLGFVDANSLSWLKAPEWFNRVYVTVSQGENDEAAIREISEAVSDKLEKAGLTVNQTRFSKSNEHPMASTVQAVLGILGALGILILFLSSSLIANTLSALLNQHQRFIGVMKLIGGSTRQIFGMYMTLIVAFSVIALAIAVPLSAQAAYGLSTFVASQMNFSLQGFRVAGGAIAIQLFIGLAAPLAAGLAPVLTGSRVTVQSAISGMDSKMASPKKGLIDRLLSKLRFLSRPYLISLRNTFRRKGRLALTLFTLTMGGAIFIAVFNVQASLDGAIQQIGNYFKADVTINFDREYRISEIASQGLSIPGVQVVEGWAFASTEALRPDGSVGDNLQFLAPPAGSALVEPVLVQGRWIEPGDGRVLTVSETIWEHFPGLKAGEMLRINIDGREEDWLVAGIFKFIGGGGDTLAYTNYETLAPLIGMNNKSFSYRLTANCEGDAACQQDLLERVESHFRTANYKVNRIDSGRSTLETAAESLNILVVFLLMMALLTAVVGSIGLAGTMGMNVMERTREIGVMRSIGAVDWQIIKSVLFEGALIGLISWVMAAAMSFPITWLLASIVSLAVFESPITLVISALGYGLWLGLVLLLAGLASVLPARSASRLTIREVLAYE